jgi:glycolate oxidase iron-sulfur subunit
LVSNGYRVEITREQGCCGALAVHSGDWEIAKPLAEKNIRAFGGEQAPRWVVLNSAGCGSAMKEYAHLFTDPTQQAAANAFSAKVIDVMVLLSQKPLAPQTSPVPLHPQKVTYHPACHLHHAQGVQQAPENVLHQLAGMDWVPLPMASECCGSAGVFNLEHPELSGDVLARKVSFVAQTGASTVVSGNPGCMLQLAAGDYAACEAKTPKVCHPVSLIAQRYTKQNL